jgi:hypothetical protein
MSLPVTCTAGFYCNATGLTVESGLCAAGYWCGAGSRSKFGLTNGAGATYFLDYDVFDRFF